jgi:cellulose synthase/poly-beta-1,6-N-acetylglucosamine synthase-like glycosyltransferase
MISIIITSFKEPESIKQTIESIIYQQIKEEYELIITAPDNETLKVAKSYQNNNPTKNIKIYRDPGKGKTYALNLLLKKTNGRVIIFTDGDVYMSKDSINNILTEFKDKKVGCVTGRPVPQEDKSTKYGFWSNLLFDAAHKQRTILKQQNKFLECSGYLWAFRSNLITEIPLDVAEDTVVPYMFNEKGYKISYSPNSKVYVKNVNNWPDWIKQKTRTTKAHETLGKYINLETTPRAKTFLNESKGITNLFTYPKSLKESYWTLQLILARLYMWLIVFYDTKIQDKHYTDAWERVDSTK